MKAKIIIPVVCMIILLVVLVAAYDQFPGRNINFDNVWNITNVRFVNGINFTGFYNSFITSNSTLTNQINSVNTTTNARIDATNGNLSSVNSTLNGRIDSVNSTLQTVNTTLQGNIDTANGRITSVNGTLNSVNTTLTNNINSVNSSLTTQTGRIDSLNSTKASLNTNVNFTGVSTGNVTLNDSGLYDSSGNLLSERSNLNVVCKGSSTSDDNTKVRKCDFTCKSSDSDCHDKIQAAVNVSGKNAYITGGDPYYTASPIVFASNVTIIGDGPKTVITTNGTEAIWSTYPSGHKAIIMSRNYAIGNQYVQNVYIKNIYFVANGNAVPITLTEYNNLHIEDCDFTGNTSAYGGGGIFLDTQFGNPVNSWGLYILRNNFHDLPNTPGSGIIFIDARGFNITKTDIVDNTFKRVMGEAIQLSTGGVGTIAYTTIDHNWFEDLNGTCTAYYCYATALFAGIANTNKMQLQHTKITRNNYITGNNGVPYNKMAYAFMIYSSYDIEISHNTAIANSSYYNCSSDANFIALGRVSIPDDVVNLHDNYVEGLKEYWDPDSMTNVDMHDEIVKNLICGGLHVGYGTQDNVHIHDTQWYNSTNNLDGLANASIIIGATAHPHNVVIENNLIDWGQKNWTNNSQVFTYGNGFNFSEVTIRNNAIIWNSSITTISNDYRQQYSNQARPYMDFYVYTGSLNTETCNINSAFNMKTIYNVTTQCTCISNSWNCFNWNSTDWAHINNFPVACPAGTAITQLGNSVICSGNSVSGNITIQNINKTGVLFPNLNGVSSLSLFDYRPADNSINDFSGNGNIADGVNYTYSNGVFGNAFSFNGSINKVIMGNKFLSIARPEMTTCLWFNSNNVNNNAAMLLTQSGSIDQGFELRFLNTGNNLYFHARNSSSGQINTGYYTNSLNNTWTHVCGTFNSTDIILYVNGLLVSDVSNNIGLIEAITGNMTIGSRSDLVTTLGQFNGSIDEVLVFNRSLSANEIKSIYEKNNEYISKDSYVLKGTDYLPFLNGVINWGSSLFRILKLWTVNIDSNGTIQGNIINATNITAINLFGNATGITGLNFAPNSTSGIQALANNSLNYTIYAGTAYNLNNASFLTSSGFNANNLTSGLVPTARVTNVTCGTGTAMQNYTSSGSQCISFTPNSTFVQNNTSPTFVNATVTYQCFNSACTVYQYYNGSTLITKVS